MSSSFNLVISKPLKKVKLTFIKDCSIAFFSIVMQLLFVKKVKKVKFFVRVNGYLFIFFHKYLSPYLSPKKIKTCKSNRYTGLCGAEGSEVELFWGGFSKINSKLIYCF